jgi:putative ABC transport system permease protein
MRAIWQTFRRVWQQPAFAATATATLALGIAAPTALFAVVYATLLRPLPYSHASQIYAVRTTMTDGRFTMGGVATEELASLRRASRDVVASAVTIRRDDTIQIGDQARQIACLGVSEEFFDLFGIPMAIGRPFAADDFLAPYGTRVVLSYRAWQGVFGGRPDVINTRIQLANSTAIVVGVAPAAFAVPPNIDLWIAQHNGEDIGHSYDAYVRLADGVTPDRLQAQLGPMWTGLAQKYPDMDRNRAFTIRPILDTIVGDLRPIVLIAFAATGVLLLLAVVNVVNLWMARAAMRARDVAVRLTLGATTAHLARYLVGESLAIGVGAIAIGVPLAYGAVRAIVAIGGKALPRVDGMRVDPLSCAFAAAIMLIAAVAIGLMPMWTLAKPSLAELANEGGRSGGAGRATRRAMAMLIVVEVSLAIALVAGAGRLLVSMQHLLAINPGFEARGRLAIDVLLPGRQYSSKPLLVAWVDAVTERLRAAGVSDVASASTLPLRREWDSTLFVDIAGRPVDPAHRPNARLRIVSANFFDVMRMRIVAGRSFASADNTGSPVVIVNQSWVRHFIPDVDPLAQRLDPGLFGTRQGQQFVATPAPIVGVVADVPYADLTRDAEPMLFVLDTQVPRWRRSLVVTTPDGHPERLVSAIRAAIASVDSRVPVDIELMTSAVDASLVWPKLGLLLMGTFGGAALLLAATGVFGVIAFVTTQRTHEMAVRLALGDTRGHVFGMVIWDASGLAVQGALVGLVFAWWTGGLMRGYVYNVSAANPAVLGGSAAAVLALALVATLPSARRAALVSPANSLRR